MPAARVHPRWWSTTTLVAVVLALAAYAAPAASGAGDTIVVTLPAAGAPFQLKVAGTAGEAAGEVWVALAPGAASSCPADPTQSTDIVFRGPVSGPGPYGAASAPLTIVQGGYTLCAWLTSAADPTAVLATEGPRSVDVSGAGGAPASGGGSTSAGGGASGGGGTSGGGASTGATGPAGARPPRVTALAATPRPHDALRVSVALSGPGTIVLTLEHTTGTGKPTVLGSVRVHGVRGPNYLTISRWAGRVPARGSYQLLARAQ